MTICLRPTQKIKADERTRTIGILTRRLVFDEEVSPKARLKTNLLSRMKSELIVAPNGTMSTGDAATAYPMMR
jgi:hypothetical protein